ncbi:MAG: patatin-like phospholipase family protein [Steroidobacterales bacterium]
MSLEHETIVETAIEGRSVLGMLASLPLFRDLDVPLLSDIANEIEWFSLPGGGTLFEAGDEPDALYFVINGCLGAYRRALDGHSQLIGRLMAGETVGEMALISGKVRTATVVALRDTEVGRFSKTAFERLMLSHPQGLLRIAQLTVARLEASQAQVRETRAMPKTFTIIPQGTDVDVGGFATELVEMLNRIARSELVWSVRGAEHTSHWFNNVESANDFVVYVADPTPTVWSKLCLRQADALLLVARAADPEGDWPVLAALPEARVALQRAEIVLLHEDGFTPGAARRWLTHKPGLNHHHVRNSADVARVSRLLTGHGVGLVLSGGGARGFAHLGVVRALAECGIPVDVVGGTSIGAIMAAGVAAGWTPDDMRTRFKRTFVDTNPLNDYTVPLVSLVSGRKVGRLLRQEFGSIDIEDLPLPYFCVSSNLTTGRSAIHREGELWRWLRASVAIPGVLPPVFSKGEVLVDGGAINNLPVDVMRELGRGPIVGVDVGADRAFNTDMDESEVPPFWKIVQWFRGKKRRVNILQILWRAGMINTSANTLAHRDMTDLLLQPPLEQIDMLNWKAFDRAIESGYRYALERIQAASSSLIPPARSGPVKRKRSIELTRRKA